MTGSIDLQTDIALAMRFPVPVLITAPPVPALAVAHLIAGARSSPLKPANVVMLDGASIVKVALGDPRTAAASCGAVLIVGEVDALSDVEQAALLLLLEDEEMHARERIIATSSICLFDRVGLGTFDARLFYRLNAIHIMGESCADRETAATPCCPPSFSPRPSDGNPARV